jgi:nucleoside-diphosphate-sugar epimerase
MLLQGKRALVTGADGFIGSRLAEALVDEGASVLAPWQFSSFKRGLADGFVTPGEADGCILMAAAISKWRIPDITKEARDAVSPVLRSQRVIESDEF